MAKIIDPDLLNQGTEIVFHLDSTPTIQLLVAGNLSNDGVRESTIYSFFKEEFKTDADLPKYKFPFEPVDGPSGTQFNLINGWDWHDATTRGLIRDGGWALKNNSGVSLEEYMNLTSLGAFDDSLTDTAYYIQALGGTPTDTLLPGEINQAIKIYGDVSHGSFDRRGYFTAFLREEAKKYAQYDLLVEQAITSLTYKSYSIPLVNEPDLKVTHTDAQIAANAPYIGITYTYYAANQGRTVGGTESFFKNIFEGNDATKEQIYEKHQYLFRQSTDIDSGAGTLRGDTATPLMYWDGEILVVNGFIDNLSSVDLNSVRFLDVNGDPVTYPYTAAGTIEFDSYLQADADAEYWMWFTDCNGNLYNTDNAVIVNNASGTPITGSVGGSAVISFSFDYDGNVQEGRIPGVDTAVVVVAIGLSTAKYAIYEGTITKSTTNKFPLSTAGRETTYTNP